MKYIVSILLSVAFASVGFANWTKGKHTESTVIEFDKGSTQLTAKQKEKIREMVNKTAKKGNDTNLGVAAWADQPFPANNKSLSSEQRDLAQKRLNAVEDYLNEISYQGDIDTFNMSQRSNWLARLFNTEDSKLKSMFSKNDTETGVLKEKYQVYREQGDAQKAVLVLSKDKSTARY